MTVMPRIPSRWSKMRRSSFVAPTDRSTAVPDALSWRERLDDTVAPPKGPAAWMAASVTDSDRTVIDAGPYGVIDLAVMETGLDTPGPHQQLGVVWWDKRSFREEDDDLGAIQTSFVPAPISDHVSLAGSTPVEAASPPEPVEVAVTAPAIAPTDPVPVRADGHASLPAPAAPAPRELPPAPIDVTTPPVPAAGRAELDDAERLGHARRSRHVALVPGGRSRRSRANDSSHPRRARLRRRRTRRRIVLGVILVIVAFVTTVLIQSALVTPFTVPSESMRGTLEVGDRILVNKLAYSSGPISRGDVVVFHDPGGWLTSASNSSGAADDYLVKRVVGIPGDRVSCCSTEGRLSINGVEAYEPYASVPAGQPASSAFDVTVPAGELWVLGDNRYNSRDSSKTQGLPGKGFVPIANVVGQATLRLWPLDRLSAIPTAAETFRSIPDQTCPI